MGAASLFVSPPITGNTASLEFTGAAGLPLGSPPPTAAVGRLSPFGLQTALFFRWECPIPLGRTITGVKIGLTSPAAPIGQNASRTFRGGFLIPDAKWETLGWVSPVPYADHRELPFAQEGHNPPVVDDTVFQDGAPAFTNTQLTTDAATDLSYAEGTLSGAFPVTGLITQLTNYLAANEALRDLTEAGSIPVAFTLVMDWLVLFGFINQAYALDGNPTGRPFLELEWDDPPVIAGKVSARADVVPTVSARPGLGSSVVGLADLEPTLSARPDINPSLSARGDVIPTIKARGDLT